MFTDALITADFKTPPYFHQLQEFEISCELPARALIWQMRTGKTKVIIDTACHLFKRGKIDCVIVLAPNGVHENWIRRELPIHHWDNIKHETVYWDTAVAGVKAEDTEAKKYWWGEFKNKLGTNNLLWISLASDTMIRKEVRSIIRRAVNMRKGGIMAVYDESHDFRRPGSKRTSMARAITRKASYRRILTGTPIENSPLHAFSQFELLEEGALGFSKFGDFKNEYAEYEMKTTYSGQSYPNLVGFRNLEKLRDSMAPWSSVVLRNDCQDLPDIIPSTRHIELTEEQQHIYTELHQDFEIELNGELVSIGENTARMVKLQQVVSGFLKDEFKDIHTISGGNPRLEALMDEVKLTDGKVIIWCAFHEDMDRVAEALRLAKYEIVEYHGRVSNTEKRKAREAFSPEAENSVKALVGYPTVGLDLSAANKIIWYSHVFDAIKRTQADERATAIGGKNISVVDFIAPGIDGYIVSNVKNKVSIADAISREGMKEVLRKVGI